MRFCNFELRAGIAMVPKRSVSEEAAGAEEKAATGTTESQRLLDYQILGFIRSPTLDREALLSGVW